MKFLILTLLFLTVCFAQGKYEDSYALLKETLKNCSEVVNIYAKANLETVRVEVDLIGTASGPKMTSRGFNANYSYAISAMGSSSRIKDLYIEICDDKGTILIRYDDNSPTAAVNFNPPETGLYFIKLIANKMVPGYEDVLGQYCLVISHN